MSLHKILSSAAFYFCSSFYFSFSTFGRGNGGYRNVIKCESSMVWKMVTKSCVVLFVALGPSVDSDLFGLCKCIQEISRNCHVLHFASWLFSELMVSSGPV